MAFVIATSIHYAPVMPRGVRIRLVESGQVVVARADRVAVELPPDFDPASGRAAVVGELVTYTAANGTTRCVPSPMRRLGHFFANERCLVPTSERTPEGRTAWCAVAIVQADHLLGADEVLSELP